MLACVGWVRADDPPSGDLPVPPIQVEKEEQARVRLVLLDVVVLDRQDRTVSDLTVEDFEVVTRGRTIPIDTLDVNCSVGSMEEPIAVSNVSKRAQQPESDTGRRIALVVDYLHTSSIQQVEVLEQAKDMVEHGAAENDQFMVAALTGGLRIEQPFTSDRETVMRTLHRMEYDISLWNGNFSHLNETGFVEGLTTLLDVLGTMPGNKALVLYSTMNDVPLDLEFQRIAAVASASRCAIYPVDAWGLRTLRDDRAARGG